MDPSGKALMILISFFFFFLSGIHAGCAPCGPQPCGPQPCGPQACGVVDLTEANFDCQVTNSGDMWIVLFAAPWCGFAKQLEPEFNQAAQNLQGKAKFGKVNCDVDTGIKNRFGINRYPTVKLFPKNDKCNPVDYNGARTACAIQDYVNSQP